ncbi:MAG TPA: metal-dependent hydrolase [Blastocatellia bacterium]|nr:metal-dependent hydrolase [Blastocatellia bacterium]
MPSIFSHPVVALGLAPIFQRFRVPRSMLWLGAFCTIVPDFDVLSFAFDVGYGDVLGHRGFTHSLLFAAILSAILVYVFLPNRDEASPSACFVFLFLCTASHGVFDALTNGGLGVAFFAPFDDTRYFLPWRPIRVSPIGAGFFSQRGVQVLLSEIRWMWTPLMTLGLVVFAINRFVSKR